MWKISYLYQKQHRVGTKDLADKGKEQRNQGTASEDSQGGRTEGVH